MGSGMSFHDPAVKAYEERLEGELGEPLSDWFRETIQRVVGYTRPLIEKEAIQRLSRSDVRET